MKPGPPTCWGGCRARGTAWAGAELKMTGEQQEARLPTPPGNLKRRSRGERRPRWTRPSKET